jgi:hypothetical protein
MSAQPGSHGNGHDTGRERRISELERRMARVEKALAHLPAFRYWLAREDKKEHPE